MADALATPRRLRLWLDRLTQHLPPRQAARPWIANFERVLGTSLELQILAARETDAQQAADAALAEIARLETVFSNYSEQSELRRWQQTLGVPQRLSTELLEVLQAGERWRAVTGGAFHPGSEALTQYWKHAASRGVTPSADELKRLVAELAQPLWRVDAPGVTATRLRDLPLNLNAIAKGFIVDCACELAAKQAGISQVLLNLGGDLRVLGPEDVVVGIADPAQNADNAPPITRIRVRNSAVATSGGYRRGVQLGDRWYSHLLDARTGWPVAHVASASVVAATAMDADVLATAFSVLQPEESLALAASLPGVACFLVGADGMTWPSTGWVDLGVK